MHALRSGRNSATRPDGGSSVGMHHLLAVVVHATLAADDLLRRATLHLAATQNADGTFGPAEAVAATAYQRPQVVDILDDLEAAAELEAAATMPEISPEASPPPLASPSPPRMPLPSPSTPSQTDPLPIPAPRGAQTTTTVVDILESLDDPVPERRVSRRLMPSPWPSPEPYYGDGYDLSLIHI